MMMWLATNSIENAKWSSTIVLIFFTLFILAVIILFLLSLQAQRRYDKQTLPTLPNISDEPEEKKEEESLPSYDTSVVNEKVTRENSAFSLDEADDDFSLDDMDPEAQSILKEVMAVQSDDPAKTQKNRFNFKKSS